MKTFYVDFYTQEKLEAEGDDLDELPRESETYMWKLIT